MVADGMIGRPISPALPRFYGGSSAGEARMVYTRAGAQSGKQKPRWFRPRKPRRWSKDEKRRHRKGVIRIASQLERRVDYLPPAERRHMAPLFILLRGVGLLGVRRLSSWRGAGLFAVAIMLLYGKTL
jgi:hypothetical protein